MPASRTPPIQQSSSYPAALLRGIWPRSQRVAALPYHALPHPQMPCCRDTELCFQIGPLETTPNQHSDRQKPRP
eukprot:146969-Pleurochrysis_carterae.AAC.1